MNVLQKLRKKEKLEMQVQSINNYQTNRQNQQSFGIVKIEKGNVLGFFERIGLGKFTQGDSFKFADTPIGREIEGIHNRQATNTDSNIELGIRSNIFEIMTRNENVNRYTSVSPVLTDDSRSDEIILKDVQEAFLRADKKASAEEGKGYNIY